VARVLEVYGEGDAAWKDEPAGHGSLLLADGGFRGAESSGLRLARAKHSPQNIGEGLTACGAAAPDDHALRRNRPAAHRLDADAEATDLRMPPSKLLVRPRDRQHDAIRLRHPGDEDLVLQPEARQRTVIRQGDGGHRRRFRAD